MMTCGFLLAERRRETSLAIRTQVTDRNAGVALCRAAHVGRRETPLGGVARACAGETADAAAQPHDIGPTRLQEHLVGKEGPGAVGDLIDGCGHGHSVLVSK